MMTFKIILNNIFNYLHKNLFMLTQIYFTFLGIFWILIFIYFRLFAPRTSYILEELKSQLTIKHYIGFSAFIIIHIVFLSLALFSFSNRKEKAKRFAFIIPKIQVFMDYVLWKPLDNIHELIAPNIPGSGLYFISLEKKWTLNNINPSYFYKHIFIFNIFPKVLVSIVFFIDIVIFGHYKYFLFSLPLIIIPILFNIYLKTFESFATRNIPVLQVCFSEIKYVGDIFDEQGNLISSDPAAYEFHVKPEYAESPDLSETIKVLYQLNTIVDFVAFIKLQTKKITPYVTLFTSSIYLLGGVYRIYYLICI